MAQGNMFYKIASLAPGAELLVKPDNATDEWTIHNVYYSNGNIELRMTNGTINVPFETDLSQGMRLGMCTPVKSEYYLVIKNTHGTNTITVACDGKQTF